MLGLKILEMISGRFQASFSSGVFEYSNHGHDFLISGTRMAVAEKYLSRVLFSKNLKQTYIFTDDADSQVLDNNTKMTFPSDEGYN